MEPELAALAGTVGTTVVTLLATEAWTGFKEGLIAAWSRARPQRAESVRDDLEGDREDLLGAQASGDRETESEIEAEWQGRVRRLLSAHPEVADDLRRLLDEWAPERNADRTGIVQEATASGHGRVYQAGRDIHLGPQ
jgi:hypothetical protein